MAEKTKDVKKAKKPASREGSSEKKGKGVIFKTGKRKTAVARASMRPGTGKVLINGKDIKKCKNDVMRLKVQEPLIIAGKGWKSYDFVVNATGGGIMGQAEAIRQSISKCLVEIFGEQLKRKYLDYDRNLLVYDPRRTEKRKPPLSSKGARKYKQRSKR